MGIPIAAGVTVVTSGVTSGAIPSELSLLTHYKSYAVGTLVVLALLVAVWKLRATMSLPKRNKGKNNRPSRSQNNELGSGDLATKAAIRKWLERRDKLDTLLPVKDIRGGDGIATRSGHLVIPREERNRHILIIAKTGSGKTTKAILPVLFNDCMCPERSTIVIDSKPEMWEKLVGMTRKYNPKKRILLFNPLDTTRGLSWNILGKIANDTDAKLIANTIIAATDVPSAKADSPFFKNIALQVLNAVMVGLLNDPNESLSMPRIHELIHSGMHSLCDWLEAHPEAIRNSKTFVELARSGSQNADTIMSELGMRLAAWDLKAIRATTAFSEIDLEWLIAEPTLFIVELRESELEMLRPIANVIVVELLRFLTKRAENCPGQRLPRPVGLVIDEFASAIGRLPDIHVKLNTLRSRNVSIVAAIQSIGQIKANYEKDADSVLTGFSTKICMPELDFQDAEWASKETGTMTVRFNVASQGKNKRVIDMFSNINDNLQEQVQQRPVLTPDEIGRPADNACTFFFPNTQAFQGHLVPYYEVTEMISKFDAGKKVDFKLRDKPIDYHESTPEPVSRPAGAAGQRMSAEQTKQALEQARVQVNWSGASEHSRDWWVSFEAANPTNPAAITNLAQEISRRETTLDHFVQVFAASGATELPQVLLALDQHLLEALKSQIGWNNVTPYARDWWIAFEDVNKANFSVVGDLARELRKRGATIDQFFSAYCHSECQTVPDILAYLDKSMAERAINEANAHQPHALAGHNGQQQNAAPYQPVGIQTAPQHDPRQPAAPQQSAPQQTVNGAESFFGYQQETSPVANGGSHAENTGAAEPVTYQSNANANPESAAAPVVSRKTANSAAAASVHVQSYLKMGEELLRDRKLRDFDMLIQLASEDGKCTETDIEVLRSLKAQAEAA